MDEITSTTPEDVERWWPVPRVDSDKYSRGVVGLDTGSQQYPGAALLGCAGALHAGAGMVRYLGEAPARLVLLRFPSVVTADGRVQAMVLGSGWGEGAAQARMDAALERGVPLVVDADALGLLPDELPADCLLTPHAGELARLLGTERRRVEAEPAEHAREAAEHYGATVLLKGPTQYVCTPEGAVSTAVGGPSWTAQAGSGDVLAGACGALLAAGVGAERAGLLAASLQAMAAVAFPGPHPPDRLAEGFADVLGRLFPQS
ncbi:NAD(P)H-hydrate dehydratase [Tessaracoccus rhinocerotis]|uniref:ADP-dependent (S)-NAD(P)H-hydrate dehydratase n=1 Tax=Tessaracoccus rhinocerotis TaxID=1689449 RepID=A0A553K575_9ACTN|nr:ADP/ATP-dependent (S)-NAD(P)H-hydrate dehydratase [Tessaracoccus rhinocerotis]TRY19856.1 NAD(P)H-hydrate dehydratase [Tessaracoccus rhinocerotis]